MTTESTRTEPHGHRIKRILKSYKESAELSLNGPTMDPGGGGGVAGRGYAVGCRVVSNGRPVSRNCPFKAPLKRCGPTPTGYGVEKKTAMERPPGLLRVKMGKCDIVETNLEGERIACFEVGGEQRLCMPQILNTVLREFKPDEVFRVCEELHIFFTRCDAGQLDALKEAKILPQPVMKCGLITYTNAERICSTLLRNQAAYKYRLPLAVDGLRVYHECFGGCKGVLLPEAFTFVSAQCIQCAECGAMFAPTQFVSHSHSELENGTIHWGFDPTNWRSYLMLSLDQAGYPRAQELLDSLKSKFEAGSEKLTVKQVLYRSLTCLPSLIFTHPFGHYCTGVASSIENL